MRHSLCILFYMLSILAINEMLAQEPAEASRSKKPHIYRSSTIYIDDPFAPPPIYFVQQPPRINSYPMFRYGPGHIGIYVENYSKYSRPSSPYSPKIVIYPRFIVRGNYRAVSEEDNSDVESEQESASVSANQEE